MSANFKFVGNVILSLNFQREMEKRISEDPEVMEGAAESNKMLFAALQEIVAHPETADLCGKNVLSKIHKTPRYRYIKNVEYRGKLYDVELDCLERTYSLFDQETGEMF